MGSPAISVLLPAYDAGATLDAALCSVERQSERDWECVVVDDGSTDGTREIALAHAARDGRVRVVSLAHSGIVAALDAGLEQCRGELVARMDADDLMARERLKRQRAVLSARSDWAGVGCHVRLFPRRGIRDGLRSYERWLGAMKSDLDVRREAFIECPIAHPTLMMRREVLARLRYRDQPWPEDYDLVLRVLEQGDALGMVPERLLHWRDGPTRLSRRSPRYALAAFVECKAEFLARTFLAGAERYLLWGFGDTGKALRQALARRGKQPSAIVELHPGRLGQRIHGAPVIPPELLPAQPRAPLLVSVAGLGPRSEIRAALSALRYEETRDYYCVA